MALRRASKLCSLFTKIWPKNDRTAMKLQDRPKRNILATVAVDITEKHFYIYLYTYKTLVAWR